MSGTDWWQSPSEPADTPASPPPPPTAAGGVNFQWDFDTSAADQAHRLEPGVSSGPAPAMSLGAAFASGWRNGLRFSGRSSRSEYWWFFLSMVVLQGAAGFLIGTAEYSGTLSFSTAEGLEALATLVLAVPLIAAGVRRLHDAGRHGLWLIVPLLNFIFLVSPAEQGVSRHR
jgi:uncharacterized membrane protein YhaH (DUF805 family)